MRHIAGYQSHDQTAHLINTYFSNYSQVFENAVSIPAIRSELRFIDKVEQCFSQDEIFDFHFDTILDKGARSISEYYSSLSSKNSQLINEVKNHFTDDQLGILNEAISELKSIVHGLTFNQLNEQATDIISDIQRRLPELSKKALASKKESDSQAVGSITSSEEFDKAIAGKGYTPQEGGVLNFLKQLWNLLTEGGSPIGILHLVLDIVGLFDFVGIGIIADILNAVIYFIRAGVDDKERRGEFILLGAISLIAGVIPVAGDVLKTLKPAARGMSKVMIETIEHGSKGGVEVLAKLPPREAAKSMQGLRFIGKNIGPAFAKATKLLSKFFDTFLAKVVGWVPLIGKPLKAFFEGIGKTFSKMADTFNNFGKSFAKAEAEYIEMTIKGANKSIEKAVKAGGKLEVDAAGKSVEVFSKSGRSLGTYPVDVLTDPKVWNKKAPGMWKMNSPSATQAVRYTNGIINGAPLLTRGLAKIAGKNIKRVARLSAFVGKQIVKLSTGSDWKSAGYTETEIEYYGSAAFSEWIRKELKKEKEETDAVYVPGLMLDSSDKEAYDRVVKYQNNYAKLFGQPTIIPVIKEKSDAKTQKEFDEFMDSIKKGAQAPENKNVSESVRLRHIVPFSNFN